MKPRFAMCENCGEAFYAELPKDGLCVYCTEGLSESEKSLFWPSVSVVLPIIVVIVAFLLGAVRNAHALEGYATYYTEESCKREGTSGVWTASGERFDENALTCAMRSREWGKKFLVYSPETGKSIIVRLNDWGPGKKATKNGTIIDLTPAGMKALGIWGKAKVNVQEVL